MNNICIIVLGGLGNQLFIIFATISYYLDNKCKDYILYMRDNGNRKYYWDTLFSNISIKVSSTKNFSQIYKEPFFHYKDLPIFNDDTLLDGYFQSYKYFEHNIDKIKKIIRIDEKINDVLLKYPEYNVNKTISVHYRMGDYLNLFDWHPVKTPKYYIDALNTLISKGVDIYDYDILYFCEKNDNETVNVYNLEINDALKKITGKDLRYKKVSDDIHDWEQLLIMTSAKHYIIGNSSFSWFGAYLSLSNYSIVCYPKCWFGPKYNNYNVDDLFPDSWIKIEDI